MKHFQAYQVFPRLPANLNFLGVLSRNMWWSWKPDAIELFRRIDPRLWAASGHNPIVFSTIVSQERLKRLAVDDSFLAHLDRVRQQFKERVLASPDLADNPYGTNSRIAYFSMEFGIHESLPLFAGGLGVLAGDHLKSSSHMGLPMVAVGLLYRQGYFRQLLDPNGWQQENYPETDLFSLPVMRVKNGKSEDLRVKITGPDGDILIDVWKIMIGRIQLVLLDTNVEENPRHVRQITARLYNSEPGIRLAQEVVLGIGGMRALAGMGIEPTVCHMNEGHCTFANIERLAQLMLKYNLDVKTALEVIARTSVFTTHTPVAAGHDEFPMELVRPYLKSLAKQIKIPEDDLLAWGRTKNADAASPFSMFILGLQLSQYCNGVSKLHGEVARRMWNHVWPARADHDTPISHVTNGIHVSSFIAPENVMLFERYLGPEWHYSSRKSENVERIDEIYDEELWRAHEMSRARLVSKVRDLLVRQLTRRNAPIAKVKAAESALDPEALTIGFSRRFATYKRADLVLRDLERLRRMLLSSDRPIQIIMAGKAHPHDNEGKQLIQRIFQFCTQPEIQNRMVFIEDYDMHIARYLVQGSDVWLNTPRRPLEACGTSGMKAAMNGVLNLSVLDGWWVEGYTPERGWCIGNGEEYVDHGYQDAVESQALYNVLENDVIPCFYNRSAGNMPVEWLSKMKASIKMAMTDFCSHRMVAEYQQRFYLPAVKRFNELLENNAAEAKRLSILHERLKNLWDGVVVEKPERDVEGPFQVEDTFSVTAKVALGSLHPEEVDVELYYGRMRRLGAIEGVMTQNMTLAGDLGDGRFLYRCTVNCLDSGRYGFTVRVVPQSDAWIRSTPELLTWA